MHLKYQFFHACPKCKDNNTVWNKATQKWACTKCLHEFTDEDCVGQCGTCTFNEGPCLPGGTSDMMQGCICNNSEQRKIIDPENTMNDIEGGLGVYRIEVLETESCPNWLRGDETEKKYLGSNVEKRVNPVLTGAGHWENMKTLGFKWVFVHAVPTHDPTWSSKGAKKVITFHKFYREMPSKAQLDAVRATVIAAGRVVMRSALEELK